MNFRLMKNSTFIAVLVSLFIVFTNSVSIISAAPGGPVNPPTVTLVGPSVDTVLLGSGTYIPNVLRESEIPHVFNASGTAQGWKADDADWDYTLPFSFTYYGVTYATGYIIKVSSNGRICFDNTQSCNDTSGNVAYGGYGPQIASLWRDLYTANSPTDDIYITTSADSVTFRWQATDCCGADFVVNFSTTLYSDGRIQFDYGNQPVPYNEVGHGIGVSSGDGVHYTISPKSNLLSYDNINSILYSYGTGYLDLGATWTDLEDGSGTISVASSGTVDINTVGTYILEYTYTDTSGTGVTITRTVNVVPPDLVAPVVSLVGSGTVNIAQGSTYTDPGATWSDNIDGTGAINTASSGSVNTTAAGTYTLTYTKVDAAGNTGSTTRTVHVVDMTAPVVTLSGSNSISLAYGSTYTDPGATWSDNIDGTGTINTASSGSVNTTTAGTYTLTYTKVDAAGNTGSTTRTIIVAQAVTSGGGGGGGGGASSSMTTTTSTPKTTLSGSNSIPSIATQQLVVNAPHTIAQERFSNMTASPKKVAIISSTTSLKNGATVYVYRTLQNGKTIKVGVVHVKNGSINYAVRQKGEYSFSTKNNKTHK